MREVVPPTATGDGPESVARSEARAMFRYHRAAHRIVGHSLRTRFI